MREFKSIWYEKYIAYVLLHGEAINLERNPLQTLKMDIVKSDH